MGWGGGTATGSRSPTWIPERLAPRLALRADGDRGGDSLGAQQPDAVHLADGGRVEAGQTGRW